MAEPVSGEGYRRILETAQEELAAARRADDPNVALGTLEGELHLLATKYGAPNWKAFAELLDTGTWRVVDQGIDAPDEWTWDSLGRFIAQTLANAGLEVSTSGVLADLVHVTLPDGEPYEIDITPPGTY